MKTKTRISLAALTAVGLLAGALATGPAATAAPAAPSATISRSVTLFADVDPGFTWILHVDALDDNQSISAKVNGKTQKVPAHWTIGDGGYGSKLNATPKPLKTFGVKNVSFYKAQAFLADFANQPHNMYKTETAFRSLTGFYSFYSHELKLTEKQAKAVYVKAQAKASGATAKAKRIKAVKIESQQASDAVFAYVQTHHIKSTAALNASGVRSVVKLSKSYRSSFTIDSKFRMITMGGPAFLTWDIHVTVKDKTDKVAYQGFTNLGNAGGVGVKVKY